MTEAEWITCTDPAPMLKFVLGESVREIVASVRLEGFEVQSFPHCQGSDRQRRLFLCACCRVVDPSLSTSETFRTAVETTERFCDGSASQDEVSAASDALWAEMSALLTTFAPSPRHWGGLFTRLVRSLSGSPSQPRPVVEARSPWERFRRIVLLRLGRLASQASWSDSSVEGINCVAESSRLRLAECGRQETGSQIASICREIFGNPFRPIIANPVWLTSDVIALAAGIYEERAFDRMPILADALQDAGCASADVLTHCRDANAIHVRGCWLVDLLLGKE